MLKTIENTINSLEAIAIANSYSAKCYLLQHYTFSQLADCYLALSNWLESHLDKDTYEVAFEISFNKLANYPYFDKPFHRFNVRDNLLDYYYSRLDTLLNTLNNCYSVAISGLFNERMQFVIHLADIRKAIQLTLSSFQADRYELLAYSRQHKSYQLPSKQLCASWLRRESVNSLISDLVNSYKAIELYYDCRRFSQWSCSFESGYRNWLDREEQLYNQEHQLKLSYRK